jgi:hypothetical protein
MSIICMRILATLKLVKNKAFEWECSVGKQHVLEHNMHLMRMPATIA